MQAKAALYSRHQTCSRMKLFSRDGKLSLQVQSSKKRNFPSQFHPTIRKAHAGPTDLSHVHRPAVQYTWEPALVVVQVKLLIHSLSYPPHSRATFNAPVQKMPQRAPHLPHTITWPWHMLYQDLARAKHTLFLLTPPRPILCYPIETKPTIYLSYHSSLSFLFVLIYRMSSPVASHSIQ